MIEIDQKVLLDLSSGFHLPPKPELLQQLHQAVSVKEPSLFDIAELIASDIGAASIFIKVINSPSYGLARTITDVRQAVMFLGMDSTINLITGFLLKQAFSQSHCSISLERFWDTAHEIADVMTMIGNKMKSEVPIENLHLLGLFHDAGIPAMALKYPNYNLTLANSNDDYDTHLVAHEERAYSTNHATVGYLIASRWHLPKHICELIFHHHDPVFMATCPDKTQKLTLATLKMAENMVHISKRFVASPDWHLFKAMALKTLSLDEDDYQDLKEECEDYFIETV